MDDKIRMLLKEQPNKGLQMAMKQYGGLCWSIARNQLQDVGTREDVEDCVSDAFAALYEAREKLDGQKGTVKSYLAVIASAFRPVPMFFDRNRYLGKLHQRFAPTALPPLFCLLCWPTR